MKNKTLAIDLNLPVCEKPLVERWPSEMSWAEAMQHFAPMREQDKRNFDSPEKRMREKNPVKFSLPVD